MTELVRALDRMGHEQAVVCGIYPSDSIEFPDGVTCFPVFFTEKAGGTGSALGGRYGASAEALFAPCKAGSGREHINRLPFAVVGMSDIMPYKSTCYRDMTPEMVSQFEDRFIDAVTRAVSALDPDLIICHHLFLLTALVRKHFPERRVVGISHGTDLRQMVNCDNLRDIVKPYIRQLDMALALHGEQCGRIVALFDMDESKVSVIGSAYNDKLFNADGRAERKPGELLRICYAGKISRPKGVPEMLAALSKLAAQTKPAASSGAKACVTSCKEDSTDHDRVFAGTECMPEFRLTMAGGCQDEALKKALDDLPDWAEWLGQIPQPALAELLRRADIFILPSYFEGLPLVLIEAMAAGAVPVSTDLPGVRPWIDANVSHPNVIYVPAPEMKSIDEPTEAGRGAFIDDLYDALKEAAAGFASGALPGALPDTSAITWDSLARRLLSLI